MTKVSPCGATFYFHKFSSLFNRLNFFPGIFSFSCAAILLFLLATAQGYSQEEIITEEEIVEEIYEQGQLGELEFSAEMRLEGLVSSEEQLPFWMYHNRRGRISETTKIVALLSGAMNYNMGYANVKVGAGALFQDGREDQVSIDELYIHFTTLRFYLMVGKKHKEELYSGLSTSNRNILWSLNAPAVPGIQIGTNGPVFFSGTSGLGIEGSWNEYLLEEDRFVPYARVHHKNILLVYRTEARFQIKAGLQHFAQWGGNPDNSNLPAGVGDYPRIIFGNDELTSSASIVENSANQLGSYELFLQKSYRDFYVEFFYNHIFDDRSGLFLKNFPDGRYGLFLNFTDRDRVIDKILFESTYTQNQSVRGVPTFDESDNYFNSNTYRSGWTYQNRILGSPFFTYDEEQDLVTNNKFYAHHLGVGGNFSNYFNSYPYKLLLTFARYEGTYNSLGPNRNLVYWSYEMLLFREFADVSVQLAGEYNSLASPIYGAGVSLSKRF